MYILSFGIIRNKRMTEGNLGFKFENRSGYYTQSESRNTPDFPPVIDKGLL